MSFNASQVLYELSEGLLVRSEDLETLEYIGGIIEDPGAEHSPGELAKLGKALCSLGEYLVSASRETVVSQLDSTGRAEIDGVEFLNRNASTQTVVNSKAVREQLPPEDYPMFYTTRQTKGSIAVSVKG